MDDEVETCEEKNQYSSSRIEKNTSICTMLAFSNGNVRGKSKKKNKNDSRHGVFRYDSIDRPSRSPPRIRRTESA